MTTRGSALCDPSIRLDAETLGRQAGEARIPTSLVDADPRTEPSSDHPVP